MSLPDAPAQSNAHAFTVSELAQSLKRTVEATYGHVRVRGEVSGVKRAASGHLYLALKDDNSVIDGVCWRGTAGKLSFRPEDGLEVICTGKLTTYAGRSKYQIVIEHMEPAGVGALMALLEDRKKRLAAEGLFDPERKRSLPFLPECIGIVTSPTGSVIRDILHRLADRFSRSVLVWPVAVQGDLAADQITAAIRGFDKLDHPGLVRPDLLIVARGGGSIEDLWSFNEETVARAVADCSIPVISAVGHETDTTLIDYVSDRRAPTPTGAAEMAVPVRIDLLATVADLEKRLVRATTRSAEIRKDRLAALTRALPRPDMLFGLKAQRLDEASERLKRGLPALMREREHALARRSMPRPDTILSPRVQKLAVSADRLTRSLPNLLRERTAALGSKAAGLRSTILMAQLARQQDALAATSSRLKRAGQDLVATSQERLRLQARMLETLSYERVLDRGYVLVEAEDGSPVTEAGPLAAGDTVTLRFGDGLRDAQITAGRAEPTIAAPKKTKVAGKTAQKRPKDDPSQGQLF